jgi:hypothetical protein
MSHRHRPISRTQAHALGTCRDLAIDFCECDAFRLNGSRWIETTGQPQDGLNIVAAAAYLNVSVSTMHRLAARGLVHGRKVRIPNQPFCAKRWSFQRTELDRYRFEREARRA